MDVSKNPTQLLNPSVELWQEKAARFNINLLGEAGLTVGDFNEYLLNTLCYSYYQIPEITGPQAADLLVGVMQHLLKFFQQLPTDQPSVEAVHAIQSWLVIHGPPLCIGSMFIDEGVENPSFHLQLLTAMATDTSEIRESNYGT